MRNASEELILTLTPEIWDISIQQKPESAVSDLFSISSALISFLSTQEARDLAFLNKNKCHEDHGFPQDEHRLLSFLRVLAKTLDVPDLVTKIANENLQLVSDLWDFWKYIDSLHVGCDEHKHQVCRTLTTLTSSFMSVGIIS